MLWPAEERGRAAGPLRSAPSGTPASALVKAAPGKALSSYRSKRLLQGQSYCDQSGAGMWKSAGKGRRNKVIQTVSAAAGPQQAHRRLRRPAASRASRVTTATPAPMLATTMPAISPLVSPTWLDWLGSAAMADESGLPSAAVTSGTPAMQEVPVRQHGSGIGQGHRACGGPAFVHVAAPPVPLVPFWLYAAYRPATWSGVKASLKSMRWATLPSKNLRKEGRTDKQRQSHVIC